MNGEDDKDEFMSHPFYNINNYLKQNTVCFHVGSSSVSRWRELLISTHHRPSGNF